MNNEIEELNKLITEMKINYLNQISKLEEENKKLMEELDAVKRMQINNMPVVPVASSLRQSFPLNNIDYSKHQEIQTLRGHTDRVWSLLKVSVNVIASASGDNTIKLWREENGEFHEIQTLTGHSDCVYSLLKVSENIIVSGSSDKTIKLWREENGKFNEIQTLRGHTGYVIWLLKVSKNVIASGYEDRTIKL